MKVTPTPGSVSGRRIDRLGDPLDGLINLFDLALVLAVGLLLAALSATGTLGLVSGSGGGGGTPINGQPGGTGQQTGQGQNVGSVYKLQDGSYVFVPSGAVKSGGAATGATGATGTTGSTGTSGASSTTGTSAPSSTTGGLGTGTPAP